MIKALRDLDDIADDSDTSPCSLNAFMNKYARDANSHHAGFMDEIGIDDLKAKPMPHLAASTSVFSALRCGSRELAWVPPGVGIMTHLDSFFIRWRIPMGVETILHNEQRMVADQVDTALKINKSSPVWVVSWPIGNKSVSTESNESTKQSGIQTRIIRPDVVTLTYMIARAIFCGQGVPFASCKERLVFARSCTRIGADHELGVAFMPNRAVYYRAFPIDYCRENLVDSGLSVVSILR
ncbi:MAG: hypothetical protein P1P90_02110 [Patescibacteria group bacterium]|nr:hypothetical protein [Patescibacteria group bacterium]